METQWCERWKELEKCPVKGKKQLRLASDLGEQLRGAQGGLPRIREPLEETRVGGDK